MSDEYQIGYKLQQIHSEMKEKMSRTKLDNSEKRVVRLENLKEPSLITVFGNPKNISTQCFKNKT